MPWLALLGAMLHAVELPAGSAPPPVAVAHFPDLLHAYVWRNWELVPPERLAAVVGATPAQIVEMGKAMGLPAAPAISEERWRRSYITIIRRNWHLLPYEQLLTLLDWSAERLAYTLREDDFLFVKLGNLKPRCEPIVYTPPDEVARAQEARIASWTREAFPAGLGEGTDPLFGFVNRLSEPPGAQEKEAPAGRFSPRFCASYFALYGDPLLDLEAAGYPEGYLARLAASGVDGIWLHAVLYKLAPFPWDMNLSQAHEQRIENLRRLTARARKHGLGVYLYLNEPRAMPLEFFESRSDLKGVEEGQHAALCTSAAPIQDYLRNAVAHVCRGVPDLAGFLTITASENLTNCWSHHRGGECPRCGARGAAEVIGEVNALVQQGIDASGSQARLLAWDWGWKDEDAPKIIAQLPDKASLVSVSEWSIPIQRGGISSVVGEYSISVIGPGPRATRHWALARERGLRAVAKIQANNTWELSAAPYIPAVANVAKHAANLRSAGVDGIMLGWSLGGYPAPNLEVVAETGRPDAPSPEDAMRAVAERRYGPTMAPAIMEAWQAFSTAFSEFPYHGGLVYTAPLQTGPANPLWAEPTGHKASMVGFPYDDLDAWRAVFPPEVFIAQFRKVAEGFDTAIEKLESAAREMSLEKAFARALAGELDVARVCAIHFRSVANQADFVVARRDLAQAIIAKDAERAIARLEDLLESESNLASRLYTIQRRDARIGYEATNHYFYVPLDLAEKVLNCRDLLSRWLPAERAARGLLPASGAP